MHARPACRPTPRAPHLPQVPHLLDVLHRVLHAAVRHHHLRAPARQLVGHVRAHEAVGAEHRGHHAAHLGRSSSGMGCGWRCRQRAAAMHKGMAMQACSSLPRTSRRAPSSAGRCWPAPGSASSCARRWCCRACSWWWCCCWRCSCWQTRPCTARVRHLGRRGGALCEHGRVHGAASTQACGPAKTGARPPARSTPARPAPHARTRARAPALTCCHLLLHHGQVRQQRTAHAGEHAARCLPLRLLPRAAHGVQRAQEARYPISRAAAGWPGSCGRAATRSQTECETEARAARPSDVGFPADREHHNNCLGVWAVRVAAWLVGLLGPHISSYGPPTLLKGLGPSPLS